MTSFKQAMNEQPPSTLDQESQSARVLSPQDVGPSREYFRQFFEEATILHVQRLVEDTIKYTTEKKAYFRESQIIKGVQRMAKKRFSHQPEVLEKKEFDALVEYLVSVRPLIDLKDTGFLTTHEMWEMENKMVDLAYAKSNVYIQPKDVFDRAIARKIGISEEQTAAVVTCALSDKRVSIVEGSAGAGKSYTMQAVKEIYEEMGWDVMGTALGWAAAKVLGESAQMDDEKCVAIEGLTRGWVQARKHGITPFTKPTLVIVDEAGMVGTAHMATILEETSKANVPVKIVLTGDSLQVAPVMAGAALETLIAFHGRTRIETIRRQHQASHRKSVYRFSQKQSGHAINTFWQQESFKWCKNKDVLINRVAQNYVSYKMAFPDKKALVLALANKDVLELNYRIRAAYKKLGLIGKDDITLTVSNGIEDFEADFSVGDDIVLRANDKEMFVYEIDSKKSPLKPSTWQPIRLGVFNRYPGRIVAIQRSKENIGSYDLTIDLQGDNPGRIILNTDEFGKSDFGKTKGLPLVHNYATTIYGSQGQTVNHVFLVDSERMEFRLAYVGMSRHKESVDVYLDETDLHRRLDKVSSKRQSLEAKIKMNKAGKSIDDARVSIGRYTRTQMLNCVSLTWGRHSENPTCLMMENLRRRPVKVLEKEAEAMARVEPASLKEDIVDFLPEFNVPYPLVDMEKILALPDPLTESELIRPSDVEENKKKYGPLELPVNVEETPIPQSSRKVETRRENVGALPTSLPEQDGFFSRLFKKKKEEPAPPKEKEILRHNDVSDPFADVEGVAKEEQPEELSASALEKLNAWLNPRAKIVPPLVENSHLLGKVIFPEKDPEYEKKCREEERPDDRPHYIDFEGVPQVESNGGPSNDFIAQKRWDMWDVGRFGEARVLAKDSQGRTVARYRLDGTCVVGEGFPPVCVNKKATPDTPVYIVSGAKEWFWLREVMENKHENDPSKIPHCIWAARDVDWGMFAKPLKKMKKVVIVRSKIDDRQIPWAQSLQDLLKNKYGVDAIVSPAIPVSTPEEPQQVSPSSRPPSP